MATFGDLKAYLEHALGWSEEPNLVRGRRATGDHARYSRALPDGGRLRTKVSGHPREAIGADLFRHILRVQLQVTEQEFWAVVRDRRTATPLAIDSGAAPSQPGIPGWLISCLVGVVGMPEDDALSMTPEAAQASWDDHRSRLR